MKSGGDEAILGRLNELANEMTRLKAQFGAELPQGRLAVVRARLGEERVCFPLDSIQRTVGMARLKPVADAAPALLGLLQMGLEFVPVLCLRRLLGLSPPIHTRASAIVLLAQGGQTRGVLVDEVEGLFEYPPESLYLVDPGLPQRKFLWGVLQVPQEGACETALLLNPLALLGEILEPRGSQTFPPLA